jgi:hypothetical protein
MSDAHAAPDLKELREQFRQSLTENTLSDLCAISNYLYTADVSKYTNPRGLLDILGLEREVLSDTAQRMVDFLDHPESPDSDVARRFVLFKWRLTAFMHVQDVFDARIYGDIHSHDWLSALSQWYFYYESKFVLTESILCGLNGLQAAANALQRLFLEFSIRQGYFYRAIEKCDSYRPLADYLSTGRGPSWGTQLRRCLPDTPLAKPVRARLSLHMDGLSESSSHPYHPDLSPRRQANAERKPTFIDAYFWFGADMILEPVLWLYYLSFPMLLQPVDWVRRYGFNGPLGIYIDEVGGHVVKESLSPQSYSDFRYYSDADPDVRALLDGLQTLPELSDDQIRATWNDKANGVYPGFHAAYCQLMAHMRATREAMALQTYRPTDDRQVELLREMLDFTVWKKSYREIGRRRGRQGGA